jgi:hypothetical protein
VSSVELAGSPGDESVGSLSGVVYSRSTDGVRPLTGFVMDAWVQTGTFGYSYRWAHAGLLATDAGGHYRLSPLPAGARVYLHVHHEGCAAPPIVISGQHVSHDAPCLPCGYAELVAGDAGPMGHAENSLLNAGEAAVAGCRDGTARTRREGGIECRGVAWNGLLVVVLMAGGLEPAGALLRSAAPEQGPSAARAAVASFFAGGGDLHTAAGTPCTGRCRETQKPSLGQWRNAGKFGSGSIRSRRIVNPSGVIPIGMVWPVLCTFTAGWS